MSADRLFDFQLPDLGEGVVEGELVSWLVSPGQEVGADQPLVQVMTDKATVEIPSPRKGTVKELYFKEGDIVPVGGKMLQIELAPGEAPPPRIHHGPAASAAPPARAGAPAAAKPGAKP
ncbi:MAG: hypothetical protein FJZ01_28490, partial [Candidatus Sericytochromatia bacterium]|nr:hypothetical protein [Candidatus Tanganyikabacteria bacterium]